MPQTYFEKTFKNLQLPVIVCKDEEHLPVIYANASTLLMLDPHGVINNLKISKSKEKQAKYALGDLLRFKTSHTQESLVDSIRRMGFITNVLTNVYTFEDQLIQLYISANTVDVMGGSYIILYLFSNAQGDGQSSIDVNLVLSNIYNIAYQTENVEEAINRVLAFSGEYVNVSRVYIFEEISKTMTRNTYEWCNKGIEPAIQDLQDLSKEDYNYDVIVNGGMYITNDVRDLPENDRIILESQGIKSLAILPLFYFDKPLGYIGFDDCENYRMWSSGEIGLLRSVADIIISLLVRRNANREAARSFAILQKISDHTDNVIYVNDIETYEVMFANKTLENALGKTAEELLGQKCWQVLQKDKDKPCEFCPMPSMIQEQGINGDEVYTWEFQNSVTGKWYLIRDAFIDWIDGRRVHIETATEITHQKKYEEQLMYYASTDTMTGVFNREWGYKLMQDKLISMETEVNPEPMSIVFIDLDGLKQTNDTYGHEVGDEMILRIIEILRNNIRQTDTICRWGGDEFILLLRCDYANAQRIMRNIQAKITKANEEADKPYKLSFSYGIADLVNHGDATLDQIISMADKEMYENKMAKRM